MSPRVLFHGSNFSSGYFPVRVVHKPIFRYIDQRALEYLRNTSTYSQPPTKTVCWGKISCKDLECIGNID